MKKIKVYIEVDEKDFDTISETTSSCTDKIELTIDKEKLQSVPDELELSVLGLNSKMEIELQKKTFALAIGGRFDIFAFKNK